ncbi:MULTISPECIES: outer membrane protein assembly factor BamD [unclassified Desulfurobacterium]|uniref:hypothetical protein n=1 Tax=Desulfurobacterium sp. TC5-1 TaxID=1158318 RepID=UPI0003B4FE81|nr:hypothetical protein [Desulfurobacterium sp. TC5-1]
MRKLLALSLFVSIFALSGCNGFETLSNKDSTEACEYKVTKALDKQDYDEAIALLNGECKNAFDPAEKNINLGAAYLGKAGYDIPGLITDILNSDDDSDPFSSFLKSVAESQGGKNLIYLAKSRDYYFRALSFLGSVNCSSPNLTLVEQDACFFKGIADFAQATTSFVSLFESTLGEDVADAIETWADNTTLTCEQDTDENDFLDSAQFSACALEYAATGNVTNCDNYSSLGNFTFGYSNKTFEVVKFTINATANCTSEGNHFDYKVIDRTGTTSVVALTSGLCYANNGTVCDAANETAQCFPCPVVSNNETFTVTDSLVELLNNGTSTVAAVTGDTDVEESLLDIKRDICEPDPSACQCEVNGTWTPCTNSTLDTATDIQISANDTVAQQLIADYLSQ